MQLKFDPNQSYQLDAIRSVVDVFAGEGLEVKEESVAVENSANQLELAYRIVANQQSLTDKSLLTNLQRVQTENGLTPDEALTYVRYTEDGKTVTTEYPNLTVEMETGTGKTYVYLRTIYELHRAYNWKKFIIVVPSVAIREGVLKTLDITHDHLQSLYDSPPINYGVYDSGRLRRLHDFAESSAVQVLVMTLDSFNKDQNIINQVRERGVRPLEYLQQARPVVILDEPQRMESDGSKRAISSLHPLAVLRYSATHRELYNRVYRLTPVDAYDLGLVKHIEVESVLAENNESGAYLKLDSFKMNKRSVSAKLELFKKHRGAVAKKSVTVKCGDNLFDKSGGVEMYREGFTVNSIEPDEGLIKFSNRPTLYLGHPRGAMNEAVQREMIAATIDNHLRKELKYREQGIKVLSVFFIDTVANYREYTEEGPQLGKFGRWFEELIAEKLENPRYRELYDFSVEKLHDGYFSRDKQGHYKDTRGTTKADDDTFTLIMQDKERLLDPTTPLRFVFSHSALREGWDNPNVFQICTLNDTRTEDRKRQEIGRGLRLSVDRQGTRIRDPQVNVLTVVANEAYEHFAASLQKEIEEETGVNFAGRIKDSRDRRRVNLKKGWHLDGHFVELWERIKHKTRYQVDYNTEELVRQAATAVRNMPEVRAPLIRRVRTYLTFERNPDDEVSEIGGEVKGSKTRAVATEYRVPDVVAQIQAETELTRAAATRILLASERLADVFVNPQLFVEEAVRAIRTVFDQLKVSGIRYERLLDDWYGMELFAAGDIETYLDNLIAVREQEKTLYDHIVIDGLSTPERNFAQECETRDDVIFYLKLPTWFKIQTPIGPYNPDWALIKQEDGEQRQLYFVAETKDPAAVRDQSKLRESERLKISCGERHFAEFPEVNFAVAGEVGDLS